MLKVTITSTLMVTHLSDIPLRSCSAMLKGKKIILQVSYALCKFSCKDMYLHILTCGRKMNYIVIYNGSHFPPVYVFQWGQKKCHITIVLSKTFSPSISSTLERIFLHANIESVRYQFVKLLWPFSCLG